MLMNNTNHTEDDVFSCYSLSVVGYRYFAVVWGCAVTITGTVGNLMTILAFALDPRLRTRFNVLIVNLAAADLLYCTILQPIVVDSNLHRRWRSGQVWCSIFCLLVFLSNYVSIITLCLVAVGRYLLVTKRAVFDRVFSDRGLTLLLISAWALGLVTFAPLRSVYVFVPQMCTCSFHSTWGRPYTTILTFFFFFLCLCCIGAFYLLIYRRVWIVSQALLRYRFSRRSSRKKAAPSAQGTDDSGVNTCSFKMSSEADLTQNTDEITCETSPQTTQGSAKVSDLTTTSSPPTPDIVPTPAPTSEPPSSQSTASGNDKEIKHVTSMCLTVFLCFVICFIPYMLLQIVEDYNHVPPLLHMICANLTWLNSCINPVLYAVMNQQFRQAYHVLLTRAAAPFTSLWTRWSTLST